ncbi:protease SohB [Oceanospirillum linum]|uniref:Protease SohB n=1 Tax=Oceanospirillum linum TaxID=966 RepID=A0A1T1HAP8_OCELI|nr:protease SohB [Oceanospirillum linum]OOV86895.1 protease SohB [Oceanospirillum linum]SEG19601.1 inner membrane peptidase. Serine peptidase. MEROPS family S49 [Oleiphilus messinensis]SMP24282.1 inner membrane peptidase. Serine peptidase. MEROPS family S49 [Oceanospirillum linum]
MYEFFSEYGLFFAKTVTLAIIFIGSILLVVVAAAQGKRKPGEGEFEIEHLNEKLSETTKAVKEAVYDKHAFEHELKAEKKAEKARKKAAKTKKDEPESEDARKRVFVLDFDGDIRASDVDSLRETISAVLTIARPEIDEVVVKLESGGGMVHSYGFAASQLKRITNKNIDLTVCVDAVAASGGYMMACTAKKILAAPFSIIGSIGVVAQIPNFNKLLKKHDIDYEVLTAGEYKRTMTVFGENTEEGRQKFVQDLEETHVLFKDFIHEQRPGLDLSKVANGDVWYGKQALELGLVDGLKTSDEYLLESCDDADVYEVSYEIKTGLVDRLGEMVSLSLSKTADRFLTRARKTEIER